MCALCGNLSWEIRGDMVSISIDSPIMRRRRRIVDDDDDDNDEASVKCARAAARILTHLIYTYNFCSLTRCRVEDTKLRADKHDFPLGPHNSDLVSFTRAPGPISQYIAIIHLFRGV